VPNHLKVVGVFVINSKKIFRQIFDGLRNINLNHSGLASVTMKQCTFLESRNIQDSKTVHSLTIALVQQK